MLSEQSRRYLLASARESIAGYLSGASDLEQAGDDEQLPEELQGQNGVFVTLRIMREDGEPSILRGCIGNVRGFEPLHVAVKRLAVEAAVADPRFRPVGTLDELNTLDIEISVLTIPERVDSYGQIRIGRDGILLGYRERSALFLPQVAVEQGWDLEQTLSHLAMKAGLNPDAWRDPDCRFETFQAEYFSEQEMDL
jgi:AmmeMemoRadiSam system protein A